MALIATAIRMADLSETKGAAYTPANFGTKGWGTIAAAERAGATPAVPPVVKLWNYTTSTWDTLPLS